MFFCYVVLFRECVFVWVHISVLVCLQRYGLYSGGGPACIRLRAGLYCCLVACREPSVP